MKNHQRRQPNNELELRSYNASIEIRKNESGEPTHFVGDAIVYNQRSEDFGGFVEVIKPEALKDTRMGDVVGLFNHDSSIILGRSTAGTLKLIRNSDRLSYEIPYDAEDPDHLRVMRKIEKGEVSGSSFQFRFAREGYRYVEADDEVIERQVTNIRELFDVGPVTFPAYQQTSASKRSFDEFQSEELGSDSEQMSINSNKRKRFIQLSKLSKS